MQCARASPRLLLIRRQTPPFPPQVANNPHWMEALHGLIADMAQGECPDVADGPVEAAVLALALHAHILLAQDAATADGTAAATAPGPDGLLPSLALLLGSPRPTCMHTLLAALLVDRLPAAAVAGSGVLPALADRARDAERAGAADSPEDARRLAASTDAALLALGAILERHPSLAAAVAAAGGVAAAASALRLPELPACAEAAAASARHRALSLLAALARGEGEAAAAAEARRDWICGETGLAAALAELLCAGAGGARRARRLAAAGVPVAPPPRADLLDSIVDAATAEENARHGR